MSCVSLSAFVLSRFNVDSTSSVCEMFAEKRKAAFREKFRSETRVVLVVDTELTQCIYLPIRLLSRLNRCPLCRHNSELDVSVKIV